jgi:chemotaxis methyl-accepting protein methylase
MVLDRAVRAHSGKAYYGVLGTDISLDSLAIARRGVYPRERMTGLTGRDINRYFEPDSEGYRVREDLRRRVAFSQLNVQNLASAPFEKMDVIFCQNLLIYFSPHKRVEIAHALTGFLKPGGALVLGVGEVVGWQAEGLEPLKIKDTLAYRKKKD